MELIILTLSMGGLVAFFMRRVPVSPTIALFSTGLPPLGVLFCSMWC